MKVEKNRELLKLALDAAFKAAEEILAVYEQPFGVEYKSDASPVTEADKRANAVIERMLDSTGIPTLTEEGEHLPYAVRKNWEQVWIVDPLDGTKEFIKRNGEFTVNIALVEEGKPVNGVIYSPVFRDLYFAARGLGAYKADKHRLMHLLSHRAAWTLEDVLNISRKLPLQQLPTAYTLVASRSHLSSETYHYLEQLKKEKGEVALINTGSSIKMCLVAAGLAHEYPRFGDTMEWDTCAGQCIIEEAGGQLLDNSTHLPLRYNREELRNPWFIARC